MSNGDLRSALQELEDPSKIETEALKRALLIQNFIDDFLADYKKSFGISLVCPKDAAETLAYIYFDMLYSKVKKFLEDRASMYKMASLTELIIVQQQFLSVPGATEEENRKINAKFAICAAVGIINCMIDATVKDFFCDTKNNGIDQRIIKLLNDHLFWLETKPKSEIPVIINAQFYESIEALAGAAYQIHAY